MILTRVFFTAATGAALTLICQFAFAAHVCGEGKTREELPYRYCLDSASSSDRPTDEKANVIYFLHGLDGSEKTWSTDRSYREVRNRWKGDTSPPIVISISFGPTWLLTDLPKAGGRSLRAIFVDDIMPSLEARFGLRSPNRALVGESIGGFNAVQLLAKNGDRFARVALVCPAIATIGPLSADDEVNAYVARHEPYIQAEAVTNIIAFSKGEFTTETDWLKHDPFMVVLKLNHKSPKLFVTAASRDELGFYEGAVRFVHEAQAQGVTTKWVPMIGGSRCRQTEASIAALAEFLDEH